MNVMARPRVRAWIVYVPTLILSLLSACMRGKQRSVFSIRPVADTVRFVRTEDGIWFRAEFMIRNNGPFPLFSPNCDELVQREIDGTWQTVWSPPMCLASCGPPRRIAAGDSAARAVLVSAFTAPNKLPPKIPELEPGRYRVVFSLGYKATDCGATDIAPLDRRASSAFLVRDTTSRQER